MNAIKPFRNIFGKTSAKADADKTATNVRQHYKYDCGAACLASVAAYYGKRGNGYVYGNEHRRRLWAD